MTERPTIERFTTDPGRPFLQIYRILSISGKYSAEKSAEIAHSLITSERDEEIASLKAKIVELEQRLDLLDTEFQQSLDAPPDENGL